MLKVSRRVLFITSFHPDGSGYIGAGEAISVSTLRRLRAEAERVDVLCLAPGYQRKSAQASAWCDSYTEVLTSRWSTLWAMVTHLLAGSWGAPWFFTRTSSSTVAALRRLMDEKQPTEVWIDFPSSLGLVRYIEGVPISYFVHDVVSQKIARSPLKRLVVPWVRRVEASLLRRVSACYLLSEKDGALLRDLGFRGKTEVWGVQNTAVGAVDNARPIADVLGEFGAGPNLVFFGNMGRAENSRSILHFALFKLWRVRREFPGAVLWVLGLAPGPLLRVLSRLLPGLKVVGAVDDPAPAFQAASVCVAPLLFGAGVKIKVLQMLEAGATVISTPVGAEGIACSERLIVVDNDQMVPSIIDYLCEATANSTDAVTPTSNITSRSDT